MKTMNKDLIYLEGGKTILNVNSIAMVFPDEQDLDNMTCINCVGIQKTFHIHEKYEDVKNKLNNWLIKEPSNPKVRGKCKAWKPYDEYCRCCSQDGSIFCFEKDEEEEEEE